MLLCLDIFFTFTEEERNQKITTCELFSLNKGHKSFIDSQK